MIFYELKRSRRKTMSLEISSDGTLAVRAPFFVSKKRIDAFVSEKEAWIERTRDELATRTPFRTVTAAEREALRKTAKRVLPPRLAFWSERTGMTYHGLTITSAEKRFGSCNGKNHICLSLYLAEYPEELADYVILHELCHTVEHNHSSRFYALLEKHLPDWREREKKLKELPLPRLEKSES